jgi:hypothetical protein
MIRRSGLELTGGGAASGLAQHWPGDQQEDSTTTADALGSSRRRTARLRQATQEREQRYALLLRRSHVATAAASAKLGSWSRGGKWCSSICSRGERASGRLVAAAAVVVALGVAQSWVGYRYRDAAHYRSKGGAIQHQR